MKIDVLNRSRSTCWLVSVSVRQVSLNDGVSARGDINSDITDDVSLRFNTAANTGSQ